MLKKLLTGVLTAGAMAVPLAAAAWADPSPDPNPPAAPLANDQGPANPSVTAVVPSSNDQGPICVVGANPPAPGTSVQGTSAQVTPGTTWQQVATLQGPVASQLGLPAGQPMNVFCAPTTSQNSQGQPTGYQPGQTNPGQTNPAPAPLQNPPGQIGPQNPAPGQQ